MRFRTQHIADSVVERIKAAAGNRAPEVAHRGASTVQLDRDPAGNLMVTKTFGNGDSEVMTINNGEPATAQAPDPSRLVSVAEGTQQPGIASDQGGIVENAAMGGDAINSLLRQ